MINIWLEFRDKFLYPIIIGLIFCSFVAIAVFVVLSLLLYSKYILVLCLAFLCWGMGMAWVEYINDKNDKVHESWGIEMTLIEMAKEAGFKEHNGMLYITTINDNCAKELERFATFVAAYEREVCAKVCESRIGGAVQSNDWWNGFKLAMNQCAASIRARGQ